MTMSAFFWAHACVVSIGVVFSVLNLNDAWRDLRVVHRRHEDGAIEVIAQSWVVREVIHLLIQCVFLSFLVLLFSDSPSHEDDREVKLLELRAVWISSFVLALSMWDWFIRNRLKKGSKK